MASALDLAPFPHFDVHTEQSNLGPRWKAWLKRFETFCVASDFKNTTRKRALLLYMAGPNVMDIFETLAETGEDSGYKTAHEKLNEYISLHIRTLNFRDIALDTHDKLNLKPWTSFIHNYENPQKIVTLMMWMLK